MYRPDRRRRWAPGVFPTAVSLVALAIAVAVATAQFLEGRSERGVTKLRLYSSNAVRSQGVPIGRGRAVVVYSVAVPDLGDRDVLLVTAEAEVTNDLPYNLFVGAQLVMASDRLATRGLSLNAGSGTNVTPAIHHAVVVRASGFRPGGAAGTRYVNLVLSADSSRGATPDRLRVERGGGQMTVLRFSTARGD